MKKIILMIIFSPLKCVSFLLLVLIERIGRFLGWYQTKDETVERTSYSGKEDNIRELVSFSINGKDCNDVKVLEQYDKGTGKQWSAVISLVFIEDEKHIRMLLNEELDGFFKSNFPNFVSLLVSYENCVDVKKMLSIFKPDILVIDIKLTGNRSGLDVLQEIRALDHNVPVVVYTAYDSFQHDLKSIAADYYVVKSVDLRPLVNIIANILLSRGKVAYSSNLYNKVFEDILNDELNKKSCLDECVYTFEDYCQALHFSGSEEVYMYIKQLFEKNSLLFSFEIFRLRSDIVKYLNSAAPFGVDSYDKNCGVLTSERIAKEYVYIESKIFADKAKSMLDTLVKSFYDKIDGGGMDLSQVRKVIDMLQDSPAVIQARESLLYNLLADTRHDLVNEIRKFKYFLKKNPSSNELGVLSALANMENSVDRLKSAYSYTIMPHFVRVELYVLVTDLLNKHLFVDDKNVDVVKVYADSCFVDVDFNFVFITLKHLIANSVDAAIGNLQINIVLEKSMDCAVVKVIDNGPGIPDEIIGHVFEKGTTTKEGHAGNGLPIALGMIQSLGGMIQFNSKLGVGTEAAIKLPISVF